MSGAPFVPVAQLADLEPGTALAVEADGIEIALVRDEDGGVHAIEDRCSHGDVALSDGDVEGCTLECWKHGSQFDLVTGRLLQLPAVHPVAVYPVRVDPATGAIAVSPRPQNTEPSPSTRTAGASSCGRPSRPRSRVRPRRRSWPRRRSPTRRAW